MIYYSLNNKSRSKTYFILAVVAIAITILFNLVLICASEYFSSAKVTQLKGYMQIPGTLTVYAAVIYLYDNFIWKHFGLPKLHKIPSIEGQWKGILVRSSRSGGEDSKEVSVLVRQTWSKISMILDTENTKSNCISVNLRISDSESEFLMLYEWKPKDLKDPNMFGEGAQKLTLKHNKPSSLSGPYFSTKGNTGVIKINKYAP